MKLIVHPKVLKNEFIGTDYILVNSKRFTMNWCLNNLQGLNLSDVEITGNVNEECKNYALSRVRGTL